MLKFRLAVIGAAFALLFVLAGYNWYSSLHHHANDVRSQPDPAVAIGGAFSLTDQDGKTVTQDILKGKWSVVFFGYTYCPDVCPLTLQSLARTQSLLGDKANNIQILFITVDPARDSPANLKAYLSSHGFPQGVIGLTGSQAQIDAATRAYRASVTRSGSGDSYSFSHTSIMYLMDPNGSFNAPLTEDLGAEKNADLIRQAMSGR